MKLLRVLPVAAAALLVNANSANARGMSPDSIVASTTAEANATHENSSEPTPSPTSLQPSSTPTPATTMIEALSTPEPTTTSEWPTPSPTTMEGAPLRPVNCIEVSVEYDATYCIIGPVCSGDAMHDPAGTSCPRNGDVAVASCLDTLPSYSSDMDSCVAPVDAQCRVVGSGAWGCVWERLPVTGAGHDKSTPSPTSMDEITPAPTSINEATPAPTSTDSWDSSGSSSASAGDEVGSKSINGSAIASNEEISPSELTAVRAVSMSAASTAALSAGATASVALTVVAVLGAVAVLAAIIWRKKNQMGTKKEMLPTPDSRTVEMVVTPSSTPASDNNFVQV